MSERPFRVLGLQQVAIGGLSKRALLDFWVELLGVPQRGSYESATENVSEAILELGSGPLRVELDLMEPLDANAKPKVHEPALNHLGVWVDDLRAAHTWLEAQGVRFTPGGIRAGAAGHEVCFVHPKPSAEAPRSAEGVLVELVQAPPEVIAAFAALERAALKP